MILRRVSFFLCSTRFFAAVCVFFLFCVSVGQAQTMAPHPRLLLDTPTLNALHAKVTANNTDWLKLKEQCDAYLGGKVKPADPESSSSDPPDVGSGYEGEEYPPVLFAEALCYQTLRASNPTLAAQYGAKAVQILMTMALPASQKGESTCTDVGYVIRNYGVGYGIGYDWLFDLLTPAQRSTVYKIAQVWVHDYETKDCSNSTYIHPLSNYFAGFFHADTVIALAMFDEDVGHPLWNDWLNTQFNTAATKPPHIGLSQYFAQNMKGGGWPEGFGSYGPAAVYNTVLPALEVRTATLGAMDVVNGASAFRYPIEIGDYLIHFTWPSRTYIDDRDTNHASGDASFTVGTVDGEMLMTVLSQLRAWSAPHADVFQEYLNEADAAIDYDPYARLGQVPSRWKTFLFSSAGATQPLATLPTSYFAQGMNAVAARSDWTTSASWMSFRAGPYVEDPNHAEQYFDQGSFAIVRGSTPLVVNPTGWIAHEPEGNLDEFPPGDTGFQCNIPLYESIYCDMYGPLVPNDPYIGNRSLHGVFYVRHMSGTSLAEGFGQGSENRNDKPAARTSISAFEDASNYVYALGNHIEDMYPAFAQGASVSEWSRQIVYVRPGRFVVYDRTTAGKSTYDQYLAFHFPAAPISVTAPAGETRYDVTYNNTFAGSMTIVQPAQIQPAVKEMYPDHPHGKVWQLQLRASVAAAQQRWITVFDTATSAAGVAKATPIAIAQGAAIGVLLADTTNHTAIVSSTGVAGVAIVGTIGYSTAVATTQHIVTDLTPDARYTVTATKTSGSNAVINLTVAPDANGAWTSSHAGVLNFEVSDNGEVSAADIIFADGFGH
jgi:hypothetical protein